MLYGLRSVTPGVGNEGDDHRTNGGGPANWTTGVLRVGAAVMGRCWPGVMVVGLRK